MQNWSHQVLVAQLQEDQFLLSLYKKTAVYNRWKEISKSMRAQGYSKTELQCRNRYISKLNPSLKFEEWSELELSTLFKCYDEYGSKWNMIETFLPGRTQMNIKNRFFSILKNLLRKLLKKFIRAKETKSIKYFSSGEITNLYEGRGKFKKFKGLLKKTLKTINFKVEEKLLIDIISESESILNELSAIFLGAQTSTETQVVPKTKTTNYPPYEDQQPEKLQETQNSISMVSYYNLNELFNMPTYGPFYFNNSSSDNSYFWDYYQQCMWSGMNYQLPHP